MRSKNKRVDTIRLREWLRQFGPKNAAAAVVSVLIAAAVIATVFYSLYNSVRDNIWLRGELNAIQSAEEFDAYLAMGTYAVKVAGFTVNELMKQGADNRAIHKFIVDETVNIQHTIDGEYTGLYCWVNNEYLDGAYWEPGPDYVPTQRPWYTETMEQGTEIAYVRPYLDLETHTVMMTIANLLSDGESVVALDVSLGRMQEITKEIAAATEGSIGMVLDAQGGVVAHSDEDQLGHEYMEESATLGSVIAHKLIDEELTRFEMKYGRTSYMVYSRRISSGWYSVSVINADIFLRPTHLVNLAAVVIAIITAIIIITTFFRVSSREYANRSLTMELSTIADIYESVYDIDLVRDTFREISNREYMGVLGERAAESIYEAVEKLADEESRSAIHEFTDLTTLDDRMRGRISITDEFMNNRQEWRRGRFIAAERDAGGRMIRVLWLVESIDAEKRHRDELLHLSETDRMTGLYNRIAGENHISAMLEEDGCGMFLLLDADRFKSVNDTYGHRVGDEVLIEIANAMKNAFRGGDVIMRLGGDEFAAYAPGVNTEAEGREIVDLLFDYLDNNHIEALGRRGINVSIGAVFTETGDGSTFQKLYGRADKCMYESKGSGGRSATFV